MTEGIQQSELFGTSTAIQGRGHRCKRLARLCLYFGAGEKAMRAHACDKWKALSQLPP